MSRVLSRKALLVVLMSIAPNRLAFGQANAQTASSPRPQQPRQQGFFDYALGKFNPKGNDYGASLQSGRGALVDHSVDDLYFWSNIVTLLLLTGTCALVFLQWRSADKKEVVAAALITELWNGRVSDRIEIDRRTAQFNDLVETHNAEVERALMLKSQAPEPGKEAAGNLSRNVRDLADKGQQKARKGQPSEATTAEVPFPIAPEAGALDLQQSNLLLQRRVEAMQSSEQNLKQRLNQTTLLLDQERRRNGSLKGA